jgi:hypothetical protein
MIKKIELVIKKIKKNYRCFFFVGEKCEAVRSEVLSLGV